jgi:hypothetical protein
MSEASRKKPLAPEPDPDPDLLDEADQEAESEAGEEALSPESEQTDEAVRARSSTPSVGACAIVSTIRTSAGESSASS